MTDQTGIESAQLMRALDTTWPAAATLDRDGWRLRRGDGGGKRVSAASPSGGGQVSDAVAHMREWGQGALFRLTPEDHELDAELAALGYQTLDPTVLYVAPVAGLIGETSHMAASYRCAFRFALVEEIWAAGGIGPGRLAVMDRVTTPKITLMSRVGDRPCGAAFAALDGPVAMIHAIEVLDDFRRQGAGQLLIEAAARWAVDEGAERLALAVTEANGPARALYDKLGMEDAGRYHYRIEA